MTHRTSPHRFAGAAIAAALALGSTPLWAQDIAPVAAPPAPTAAPAAPTIVLPPVTAAPVAPVAVPAPEPVTSAPVREPAAPRAAAQRAPAPATRAVSARPAAAAAAPSNAVTAEPAQPSAPEAPAALEPVEAAPAADTPLVAETATAAPAESDGDSILPLAGLLAALGIGGIALIASRRRRREIDEVEPTIVAHETAPAITPRAAPATPPVFAPPAANFQRSTQDTRPTWQEPRRTAVAGTMAASVGNREALLDRMVAAEPDANNPFTSAKARRRRARLMLQSMDDQRWDDAELEPGFDWREQARATRERETVSA